jgi:hypothetical protein
MWNDRRTRLAIATVVATTCSACSPTSPSESLTGTWRASSGHSGGFYLSLQQTGEEIRGTACGIDSGRVLYRNAPVRGTYPRVLFTAALEHTGPCCAHLAGTTFFGRIDGSLDIVGTLSLPNGGGSGLRFKRSDFVSRDCSASVLP